MAVILQSENRVGNVVKFLEHPTTGIHFEVVTIRLAGAATLKTGTVLAKVTATGKYLVQDASLAAGAGLEAAGVLIGTDELGGDVVCAANTDVKALVLVRGDAKVAKRQLIMGAGTDQDAEKLAVYDALAALRIFVVDQA